ncbi:MAG: protein kinase [Vicinamibacterales bacterium]
MIGSTLGRYRVVELLGRGGMGEVYRAHDERLRRDVALKILSQSLASDPDWIERFEREARLLASLNHPNIAAIFGLDESDGLTFLVLELVDGTSLDARLRRGPMPLADVVDVSRQIAAALEEAHGHGIVHRDLKPSNVMTTRRGRVKVLDFGLARSFLHDQVEPADDRSETRAMTADVTHVGLLLGTPAYMSPEQATLRPLDARSDLFSFGIMLYEMATGRHPFRVQQEAATLHALLHDDPAPPSTVRDGLPPALDALVRQLLARKPEDRLATASALRAELGRLLDRRAAAEPDPSPTVAVLPFANLSSDPENEFLADGMADEIISALTKVESLRVMSRTSSFALKGQRVDIRELARALDVKIVLEGSVRRAGSRIRVSTQLIDATNGYHLWSDRFDRSIEDVFDVQDQIAESVAGALRIVLSGREKRALQRVPTSNLEAYDLYLRARSMVRLVNEERGKTAQYLFRRAVELDPAFLPAWLGLAEASLWIYQWGLNARNPEDLQVAIEAGERAIALAPNSAEALTARGMAAWLLDETEEAAELLERARSLDPRLWEATFFLARVRMTQGNMEAAVEHYLQAADIQPDDYQSLCLVDTMLGVLGRQDERLDTARRALKVLEQHVRLHPDDARAYYLGTTTHLTLGHVDRALEWAKLALHIAPHDGGVAYNVACFYLHIGRHDEALDLLEQNVGRGWGFRRWLEMDPDMEPIREHPRFKALLDRMGPRP